MYLDDVLLYYNRVYGLWGLRRKNPFHLLARHPSMQAILGALLIYAVHKSNLL